MWVKLNSLPGTPNHAYTFLVKDPTNTDTVFIGVTNLGSLGQVALNAFFFPPDGNWFSTVFSNSAGSLITAGVWFHLVVTFDEATVNAPHGCQIYVNGVVPGGATYSDNASSSPVNDSGDGYYIGNDTFGTSAGTDGNMDGDIAEVVIFPNVVLTPTQVMNLFSSTTGVPGGFPSEAAYWHLCGTASPEPDSSGNGLNAVLSIVPPTTGPDSPGFACSLPPLPPGAARSPRVNLRWSDDGGCNWSNSYAMDIGQAGECSTRVIWRRLGRTRGRIYELSTADPVPIRIVDAYLDVEAGLDG